MALVAAGLPYERMFTEQYGIDRFSLEDYVLRLALERQVFESATQLRAFPYDLAVQKLHEVRDLFRRNNIPLTESKRYLQVLRATAGFEVSPATFTERLVTKAAGVLGIERLRAAFSPLVDQIDGAVAELSD